MDKTTNPIKSFAKKTGMSSYKIAAVTGVSQPTVNRHVNGRQKIGPDSFEKYFQKLSISKKQMVAWNNAVQKYQTEKFNAEREDEWQ